MENKPEQIEITQVIEAPQTLTSKAGNQYSKCVIQDGKTGRIATAMGGPGDEWVLGMKVGDTFEAIWEANEFRGQQQWNIKNPNRKSNGGGRQGGGRYQYRPNLGQAYGIAAQVAPVVFAGKDKVKLEHVTKLAYAILEELRAEHSKNQPTQPTQPQQNSTPSEPAPQQTQPAEPAQPAKTDNLEENIEDDDDELF